MWPFGANGYVMTCLLHMKSLIHNIFILWVTLFCPYPLCADSLVRSKFQHKGHQWQEPKSIHYMPGPDASAHLIKYDWSVPAANIDLPTILAPRAEINSPMPPKYQLIVAHAYLSKYDWSVLAVNINLPTILAPRAKGNSPMPAKY